MSTVLTAVTDSESNSHLDAASRIRSVEQRTRLTARGLIKRCLVSLAGLLGVIAILVTVAPFFGWTVVRLATGSMTPVFPTDSLLITHQVPASQVAVGDIVMVQRQGELPITHRVIAMQSETGGVEQLTLKGDANATKDPAPYEVRTVGLVTAGIPWGGQLFAALRSTPGLAALTVFAALIVLWAWWPSKTRGRRAASTRASRSGE